MQLRHISPRSIDWVDAMDEGSGGQGWEKLAPEERSKLRHNVEVRGRIAEPLGEAVQAGGNMMSAQGLEPDRGEPGSSPSR